MAPATSPVSTSCSSNPCFKPLFYKDSSYQSGGEYIQSDISHCVSPQEDVMGQDRALHLGFTQGLDGPSLLGRSWQKPRYKPSGAVRRGTALKQGSAWLFSHNLQPMSCKNTFILT